MTARTMLAWWQLRRDRAVHQMVRLDMGAAIEAIREGFAPWGCIAEVYGFQKRLRCRIVDIGGNPIIDDFCLSSPDLLEPTKLRDAIHQTRVRLEEKGIVLQPWKPRW